MTKSVNILSLKWDKRLDYRALPAPCIHDYRE